MDENNECCLILFMHNGRWSAIIVWSVASFVTFGDERRMDGAGQPRTAPS